MNLISAVQQMPEVFAHIRVVIGHDDQFAIDNRLRTPLAPTLTRQLKTLSLGITALVDRTPLLVRRQPSLRLLSIHVGRDSSSHDGSCRLGAPSGGRIASCQKESSP